MLFGLAKNIVQEKNLNYEGLTVGVVVGTIAGLSGVIQKIAHSMLGEMWSNIAPALGLPATLPASFTYLGNKLEYQSSLSYNAHNFADKKNSI